MIKTTYEKQKNSPNRRSFSKIGGTFSLPNLIENLDLEKEMRLV